jgi:uncharacterized protein YigE (DUF2233 family)
MSRRIVFCLAPFLCVAASGRFVQAQAVVHAMTGTVSSIDPANKTITLFLDGGSQRAFKDMTNMKVSLSVDKKLLADTTTPDEFKKQGAYVIAFYIGGSEDRSIVALRSLGAGPFTATSGTVARFDGRRAIAVQDNAGALQSFKLGADTVAESGSGAMSGLKFTADKGARVHVVGGSKDGEPIALFVSQM